MLSNKLDLNQHILVYHDARAVNHSGACLGGWNFTEGSDITEPVRHRSEKWDANDGIQILQHAGGKCHLDEISVITFIVAYIHFEHRQQINEVSKLN